ncbi:hypothetical protein CGLO_09890 [Colletotrichum gloeosporioides Cg-14]|uniref:Uncharacterized protein n=1 Tax=Colletotrichum gloeosporioides (strain Cg-14) TaxID=1237896 RepID=T0K5C2_COLGC|nr:hypothetical protein CGLO_09890 [Colletotrichum gloeosporioides Cg-14]
MPAHYHQQSNPPQRAQLSSLATDTLGLACPNLATNRYFIKGLPHTVMKKAPNGSRKRKMYRGSSEPRSGAPGAWTNYSQQHVAQSVVSMGLRLTWTGTTA